MNDHSEGTETTVSTGGVVVVSQGSTMPANHEERDQWPESDGERAF